MSTFVYPKLLGEDFSQLGPFLQLGHGSSSIKASGKIDVEYGKGWLIRTFNKMNGLPPEGKNMDLILDVVRLEEKEIWRRSFNGKIFSTDQYVRNGFLAERAGSVELGFKVYVKDHSLFFEQVYTRFLGIRLPGFMSIFSKASAVEHEDGWKVEVNTLSPLLGQILNYKGCVRIEK